MSKIKNKIYTSDKTVLRAFTPALRALCKRAVNATLEYEEQTRQAEVSVTLVDEEEIRALNRDWRERDSVTDVLSFPTLDDESEVVPFDDECIALGDVILCYARCAAQAEEFGHSVEREIAYLTIHSTLHLLGYDHLTDEDERTMTEKQDKIIATIGL